MTVKRASTLVSYGALAKLLHLRPGITITGCVVHPQLESLQVLLTGDDFEPVYRKSEPLNHPLRNLQEFED